MISERTQWLMKLVRIGGVAVVLASAFAGAGPAAANALVAC
jgi:hypothetical protein